MLSLASNGASRCRDAQLNTGSCSCTQLDHLNRSSQQSRSIREGEWRGRRGEGRGGMEASMEANLSYIDSQMQVGSRNWLKVLKVLTDKSHQWWRLQAMVRWGAAHLFLPLSNDFSVMSAG
jgi:hypothetical protein